MDTLKNLLSWPLVVLIAIGAAVFVATFWAPPDVRHWILGSGGLVSTLIGYYLESPRSRGVRMQSTPPAPPPPLGITPPPANGAVLLLVFLAPVLALTHGCGGATWQSKAQTTLPIVNAGLVAADGVAQSQIHCDPSDTVCAAHLTEVTDALSAAEDLVISTGAALTASIQAGVPDLWLAAASCLSAAVQRVIAAISAAGVTIPVWLTQADAFLVSALGALAGPCQSASVARFALHVSRPAP